MQLNLRERGGRGRQWLDAAWLDVGKVRSLWKQDGAAHALRTVLDVAAWRVLPARRAFARRLLEEQELDRAFDKLHGVDTSGDVSLTSIGVDPATAQRSNGIYRPIWSGVFRAAMGGLKVRHEELTFVDFGSGKGKALFLSAEFPFHKHVGVELSQVLHDAAQRNIRDFRGSHGRTADIESHCINALDFELPATPLVCFFFNPFDQDTLGRVLERMEASFRRQPRQIYAVYANVRDVREHRAVFEKQRFLVLERQETNFLIYRAALK
jgi:SAM-dependent methyltransferase